MGFGIRPGFGRKEVKWIAESYLGSGLFLVGPVVDDSGSDEQIVLVVIGAIVECGEVVIKL